MNLTKKYQPAIVPALNLATNWRPDSIVSASGKLWNHRSDRVEAKQIFSYTRIIIINCLGQWKGDAWIMKNTFRLHAFTKLHNLLPHSSPLLFQKHHRCCKITLLQLRATHIQHTHWESKLCVRACTWSDSLHSWSIAKKCRVQNVLLCVGADKNASGYNGIQLWTLDYSSFWIYLITSAVVQLSVLFQSVHNMAYLSNILLYLFKCSHSFMYVATCASLLHDSTPAATHIGIYTTSFSDPFNYCECLFLTLPYTVYLPN